MKNFKAILLTVMLISAPISGYTQSESSGSAAAGGMSVGTAVAIGVVGAALLVALGDSSSSSPGAVSQLPSEAGQSATTTAVSDVSTTTTLSSTTTTTN